MILVGISGKKFSGKDTIADYLVRRHGFQKLAFAGPLKELVRGLFLMDDRQVNDPSCKEEVDKRWGISPRRAMQLIGTDWVRNQLDPDFWTKRMALELGTMGAGSRVVIADVRFPNEKQLILDMGGRVMGVHRAVTEDTDNHESETVIEDCLRDVPILENESTREDLYKKIDFFLEENKII